MKIRIAWILLLVLALCGPSEARGGGHGSGGSHRSRSAMTYRSTYHAPRASGYHVRAPRMNHSTYRIHAPRAHRSTYHVPRYSHTHRYAVGVQRDSHGRIVRSEAARREFMRETGYPHGRRGYVIDHVVPLKRGGADSPSNMQWQTKEEAKAKDRWE